MKRVGLLRLINHAHQVCLYPTTHTMLLSLRYWPFVTVPLLQPRPPGLSISHYSYHATVPSLLTLCYCPFATGPSLLSLRYRPFVTVPSLLALCYCPIGNCPFIIGDWPFVISALHIGASRDLLGHRNTQTHLQLANNGWKASQFKRTKHNQNRKNTVSEQHNTFVPFTT